MKMMDAMRVEGAGCFEVLCYGAFAVSDLDSAYRRLSTVQNSIAWKIFHFLDDDWAFGVVLTEARVPHFDQVSGLALEMMNVMHAGEGCLASACMYDATFGGDQTFLNARFYSSIYAYSLCRGVPIMALDDHVISSKAWQNVIEYGRSILDDRIRPREDETNGLRL